MAYKMTAVIGGAITIPIAPNSAPPIVNDNNTVNMSIFIFLPTIKGVMKVVTKITMPIATNADINAVFILVNTRLIIIIGISAIIGPMYGITFKNAINIANSNGIEDFVMIKPIVTVNRIIIPSINLLKP